MRLSLRLCAALMAASIGAAGCTNENEHPAEPKSGLSSSPSKVVTPTFALNAVSSEVDPNPSGYFFGVTLDGKLRKNEHGCVSQGDLVAVFPGGTVFMDAATLTRGAEVWKFGEHPAVSAQIRLAEIADPALKQRLRECGAKNFIAAVGTWR